jgi:hypothetical protein
VLDELGEDGEVASDRPALEILSFGFVGVIWIRLGYKGITYRPRGNTGPIIAFRKRDMVGCPRIILT